MGKYRSKFKKVRYLLIGLCLLLSLGAGLVTTVGETTVLAKIEQKIKYIGKDRYQIAKKEHQALLAKQKKLQKQNHKLAVKKTAVKKQVAADQKQAEQEQADQAATTHHNQGDMNTAQSGQIVGNSRSHIYHVPGQRGYKMNSSNAVYFKTEQDAINAGYRKAKL